MKLFPAEYSLQYVLFIKCKDFYILAHKNYGKIKKIVYLPSASQRAGNFYENGRVAEWLGRGLQNLVQRFESASDLKAFQRLSAIAEGRFAFMPRQMLAFERGINAKRTPDRAGDEKLCSAPPLGSRK